MKVVADKLMRLALAAEARYRNKSLDDLRRVLIGQIRYRSLPRRIIIVTPVRALIGEHVCESRMGEHYTDFYPILSGIHQVDTFDIVRTCGADWNAPAGHEHDEVDIYCDGKGALREPPLFMTVLANYPQPIAGRLVICGGDGMGETISAPAWLTPKLVAANIRCRVSL